MGIVRYVTAFCLIAATASFTTVADELIDPAKKGKKRALRLPKDPAKKQKPAMVELNLTGRIVKQEKMKRRKDDSEHKVTFYTLQSGDDTIRLPKAKKRKKDKNPMATNVTMDLAQYEGQLVNVLAKGFVREGKRHSRTVVKEISSITPAVEPGAAAP